ncbi:MAG: carboxypeptidase regulatory-like domain-containing protein [Acidobacteriaceae bacterium]|nr:carboxypeptidase regulatory-like domain-containing protein [Acidobacteriaceae bacterium]
MRSLSPVLSVILTLLLASPGSAQAPAPVAAVEGQDLQLRILNPGPATLQISSRSSSLLTAEATDPSGAPVPDAVVAFRLPDSGATGTFADGTRSAVTYTDGSGKAAMPEISWNATPGPMTIRITAAKGIAHAGLLLDRALVQPLSMPPSTPLSTAKAASGSPAPGTPAPRLEVEQSSARSGASGEGDSVSGASEPLSVTVTSASPGAVSHGHKKWIILAAVAVAAGVGTMMALRAGSATSSSLSSSGISIGAPSISIGHP